MASKGTRNRSRFICQGGCLKDTGKLKEFYYLKLDIWLSVVGSKQGMLCIGCFEAKLGRQLVSADFTSASINNPKICEMSDKLRNRITGKNFS